MVTKYLTVGELTRSLNTTLEQVYPQVFFQGEISGVARASSGHVYFSVKDSAEGQKSKLDAVMWRSTASTLSFPLVEGLAVLCVGRPNIYPGSGKLQVIVHKLIPSGEGLLQKRYLELQRRLQEEGLFSTERKRPLPFFPKAVGVVTSKSGAVIHDIMVKVRERMPSLQVHLVDVRVQGEGAAEEIAAGIRLLNERNEVEVIIVARGGGSLEDLWAFNEEVVVRAIFASRIPVVSGVGHETDTTLSDLVADLRAPTPTAAAEAVVPRRDDLLGYLRELERRLEESDRWFRPLEQRVDDLERTLRERLKSRIEVAHLRVGKAESLVSQIAPQVLLGKLSATLDQLQRRLHSTGIENSYLHRQKVEALASRLDRANSPHRYQRLRERVEEVGGRLSTALGRSRERRSQTLIHLEQRLYNLSPQAVLDRGFAIIRDREGKIIQNVEDAKRGQEAAVELRNGMLEVSINNLSSKR